MTRLPLPPLPPPSSASCTQPAIAARAVALGYNIMSIDSDVVALGNFYARVKSPPLSAFAMISQSESGVNINGGFSYFQNAAPDGPTAYLAFSVVYKMARYNENPAKLRAAGWNRAGAGAGAGAGANGQAWAAWQRL